ncbi:type VI secretion system contractile sheath small subunit [Pseudomonas sp. HLS-6]|uniref:type VI secretion system contractile sheath small subunit n=1 Tax=Pseudomonas sp. HLS-6 TaxID=2049589 RepID=UPI000C1749C0|nr:type VI secretion system contractile sheath small subunit [Pseudomonas sp. HLS-6]ATR83401.1 type VI secretion system contractile sheath small subunit [Pseudomonas sp. HLS-6]
MSSNSGQKFIGRNRAPRVQIDYDVELYGAEKTVEIPFVNGVLTDLSGANTAHLPSVADRKFLEIDIDNFDERMNAIAPSLKFAVKNELTGEGQLSVALDIKSMDDFSPGAIARNVEPLNKLLEARNQLSNLLTYMDGKSGAEQLVAQLLQDPALMSSLLAQAKSPAQTTE